MKVVTLALAAAAVLAPHLAGAVTGPVSSYIISTPDIGSCRLKGITADSDNFKHYASVSGRDATLNDGCARCIKATRDDDATKTVNAYVLDVAQSAPAGSLKLSPTALEALAVDVNSNNVSVTYRYIPCPTTFATGNVKACLMEGASNAYIPLQFYNAQKVIASVTINGVAATSPKESYLFSATSGESKEGTSSWFSNLAVEMTSFDNETLTGTFAFGAASGCATYTSQFSAASTADGANISANDGSDGDSSALVPALIGGIAALFLVIGSVFFVRRRRMARAGAAGGVTDTPNDHGHDDVESQYLEPKAKPLPSPAGPTYASEHSNEMESEPRSPTIDYEQSYSPAASAFAVAAMAVAPAPAPSPVPSSTADQSVSSSGSGSHSNSNRGSTFSYSKPMAQSFSSNVSSPRQSKSAATAPTAPTFQAPVVPMYATANRQASYEHPRSESFSDEEDGGRSSFDIDDMRNTEEMKTAEPGDERFSAFAGGRGTQSYGAPATYGDSVVTSPQSYVRATSLRRNTATRTPSMYRQDSNSGYGQDRSNAASFARESSGYSRDSLSVLGYPYAKKSGRHNSTTEAQF